MDTTGAYYHPMGSACPPLNRENKISKSRLKLRASELRSLRSIIQRDDVCVDTLFWLANCVPSRLGKHAEAIFAMIRRVGYGAFIRLPR